MVTLEQIKTLLNGIMQKIPPLVKPDLDENDEQSPNYVKGRTHWTDAKGGVHRLPTKYMPVKMPSSYCVEAAQQAEKVVSEKFYTNFENSIESFGHKLIAYNSPVGHVSAIENPRRDLSYTGSGSWAVSYFEYPGPNELITFPGNTHIWSAGGLCYLDLIARSYNGGYDYYYLICKTKMHLPTSGGNTGHVIQVGYSVSPAEFVAIEASTGKRQDVSLSFDYHGQILVFIPKAGVDNFSKAGIAMRQQKAITVEGPEFTINNAILFPYRLRMESNYQTMYCRTDPHITHPEVYPYALTLNKCYETMTPGTILETRWSTDLPMNDWGTPNYEFMADAGLLHLFVDNKYHVYATRATWRGSDADTDLVGQNGDWLIEFAGTTTLFEDDGQRYTVTLKGKIWNNGAGGWTGPWFKLIEYTKVLLPSTPSYTSEDEGKVLKIVNGVPTWVSE